MLDSSLLSTGGDLWSPYDIMDVDAIISLSIVGGTHPADESPDVYMYNSQRPAT